MSSEPWFYDLKLFISGVDIKITRFTKELCPEGTFLPSPFFGRSESKYAVWFHYKDAQCARKYKEGEFGKDTIRKEIKAIKDHVDNSAD